MNQLLQALRKRTPMACQVERDKEKAANVLTLESISSPNTSGDDPQSIRSRIPDSATGSYFVLLLTDGLICTDTPVGTRVWDMKTSVYPQPPTSGQVDFLCLQGDPLDIDLSSRHLSLWGKDHIAMSSIWARL